MAVVGETFFSVGGLNPGQPHSLSIKVASGVNPRMFVIDAFVVANGADPTSSSLPLSPSSSVANPGATPGHLSAHTLSAGEIFGVVVGCLAGIILLVVLFLTLCGRISISIRRRPTQKSDLDTTPRPLFTARHPSRRGGSREIGGKKTRYVF